MQPLRFTLRLNALTCAAFGLLFVFASKATSQFLGGFPEIWLRVVGALLVLHSVHLVWASIRRSIRHLEVYYFSAGDLLWFLASLYLLLAPGLITTTSGAILTIVVGVIVDRLGTARDPRALRDAVARDDAQPAQEALAHAPEARLERPPPLPPGGDSRRRKTTATGHRPPRRSRGRAEPARAAPERGRPSGRGGCPPPA